MYRIFNFKSMMHTLGCFNDNIQFLPVFSSPEKYLPIFAIIADKLNYFCDNQSFK